MLTTLIRTGILYIFVLLAIRCIGKNGLSSSDPFQIVMVLMISELASIPMESSDVPVVNGIAAVTMIIFLYSVSAVLSYKSEKFKLLLNGKPSILIDNGRIDFNELKKASITITDLTEMLRLKDSANISDVLYAYLETNGEFSIILKPEKVPATREDLGISRTVSNMPCILISDGTMYDQNLSKANLTKKELHYILHLNSISEVKDILLCFCDEDGKLYFYTKSHISDTKSANDDTPTAPIVVDPSIKKEAQDL